MTTVIFIARERTDLLCRALDTLAAGIQRPERTIVVVNNDPPMAEALQAYPWVEVIAHTENMGFWHGLNSALEHISLTEPFCYFGQDVEFAPDWLGEALKVWSANCPEGLGVLTFQDGIQNGLNASHGMTTRRWLQIIWGEPFTPDAFWHMYADSELSRRSQSLQRMFYAQHAVVTHKHQPIQYGAIGEQNPYFRDDTTVNNQRHYEWVGGGYLNAVARYLAMVN